VGIFCVTRVPHFHTIFRSIKCKSTLEWVDSSWRRWILSLESLWRL